MTFTGRVTLDHEEIKALVAAEISRRLQVKIEAQEVWLGLRVSSNNSTCESYVTFDNSEIGK